MHSIPRVCRWLGAALGLLIVVLLAGFGLLQTQAGKTWLAASALFSWYAANFGNFNKTYGSLGAIIGFMTWMWLLIIVVLVGGKLNAVIENEAARKSTVASSTS